MHPQTYRCKDHCRTSGLQPPTHWSHYCKFANRMGKAETTVKAGRECHGGSTSLAWGTELKLFVGTCSPSFTSSMTCMPVIRLWWKAWDDSSNSESDQKNTRVCPADIKLTKDHKSVPAKTQFSAVWHQWQTCLPRNFKYQTTGSANTPPSDRIMPRDVHEVWETAKSLLAASDCKQLEEYEPNPSSKPSRK